MNKVKVTLEFSGNRIPKGAYCLLSCVFVGEHVKLRSKHIVGLADGNGEDKPVSCRGNSLCRYSLRLEPRCDGSNSFIARLDVAFNLFRVLKGWSERVEKL